MSNEVSNAEPTAISLQVIEDVEDKVANGKVEKKKRSLIRLLGEFLEKSLFSLIVWALIYVALSAAKLAVAYLPLKQVNADNEHGDAFSIYDFADYKGLIYVAIASLVVILALRFFLSRAERKYLRVVVKDYLSDVLSLVSTIISVLIVYGYVGWHLHMLLIALIFFVIGFSLYYVLEKLFSEQ